ncbi:MAG: TetR/AcrR family transcriptional regulator [Eubacterium sp.]|nr:TetR/AcrR family transcriptional regulator [Eubacterium sp.]
MDKNTAAYRRMDKVILNAFIEIAQETPFENITVQKIADAALVSRYTFYAHFHDKYEVAERIQDELCQEFTCLIQKELPTINAAKVPASDSRQMRNMAILDFYRKHSFQTRAIINIHTETIDLTGRLKTFLAENYQSRVPEHENLDLEANLYANMAMTLSEYYFTNAGAPLDHKAITSSYIYTFLYALGIHDEQMIQKEYNRFMQMKYPDDSFKPHHAETRNV